MALLPPSTSVQKQQAENWFQNLQTQICEGLETLEKVYDPSGNARFQSHTWDRADGGGGCMMTLEGALFEKAGVNVSTVFGTLSPDFAANIQGAGDNPTFWASGLSLVIHPRSPHVPIIHMNTRHMVTTHGWFGGGIDLTPVFPNDADTTWFHTGLQKVCDPFDLTFYPQFKAAADQYFFIPHRQEPRGVGGIFYDDLNAGDWDTTMAFTQEVGRAFLPLYTPLVQKNWRTPWGETETSAHLKKRGRYVEFNLIYDRGTLFGLKTKGNIEAILMSLPPQAGWPPPRGHHCK